MSPPRIVVVAPDFMDADLYHHTLELCGLGHVSHYRTSTETADSAGIVLEWSTTTCDGGQETIFWGGYHQCTACRVSRAVAMIYSVHMDFSGRSLAYKNLA